MGFDRSDLFRFCDDHNIRVRSSDYSLFSKNLGLGVLGNSFLSTGNCLEASEILRNLPRERIDELLDRIRDIIRRHGKDSDRIKSAIKDFLKSLGYRF